MKNLFFCLICLLTVFLFSCTSTNVAPTNSTDSVTSEESEDSTIESDLPEEKESPVIFPLPDALIEPEIITLEPPEEPEPVIEIEEEPEAEIEPELIIVEEPKPIIPVENKDDSKGQVGEKPQIEEKDSISKNINLATKETLNTEGNLTNGDDQHPEDEGAEETPTIEEVPEEVSEEAQEDKTAGQESEGTEESITPSRSVTIKIKEYVDITYPGSGWIYMGATDGSKNLTYFGRGLGTKDTTFSLQGRYPGTKILHFYKNDHLTNEYLDDYIEVTILNETGSNKTHISAPEYKQPVPKKSKEMFYKQTVVVDDEDGVIVIAEEEEKIEKKSSAKQADARGAAPKASTPIAKEIDESQLEPEEEKTTITDPNTLLKEAQLLYNEKEFELAFDKVNDFLSHATRKLDEGLYLKGQILEAKSKIQDIKGAIASYDKLIKEYPASRHWDAAKKRIVYLKRFYLEVR